jgi:putative inorganic carbon (hco3(-)) transporter
MLAIAGSQVGPLVPVVLVFVGAVFIFGFMRPMWALYAAIALIPVTALTSSFGGVTVTPMELMFYAAAIGWVARRLASGDLRIRATPLNAPFALMVVSIAPALLFAVDPLGVGKQLISWTLIFLCFLMLVSDGDEHDARRIALLLAAVGGAVGLFTLISPPDSVLQGRAQGPFGQPNTLGQFIIMPIPLAIAFVVRPPGPHIRSVMIVCAALAMASLIASASRGSLIGVLAMVLVYLAWRPFRYFAAVAAIVFAAVIAMDFQPVAGWAHIDKLTDRITRIGEPSDEASVQRLEAYEKTPEMIIDHPIFGVGANNFRYAAPEYDLNFPAFTNEFGQAHNTLLHIAAERGLVGLAALIWFAVALAQMLWRTVQSAPPEWRALAFGLAGAFAGQLLVNMFESGLPDATIALTTFVLAGCACLVHRLALQSVSRQAMSPLPVAQVPANGASVAAASGPAR